MEVESIGCKSKKRAPLRSTANRSNGLQFEWVAEALARRQGWTLWRRHSRWAGVEADRLFFHSSEILWIEARWRRTPTAFERTIDRAKIRRLVRGAERLSQRTGMPVRLGFLLGWGPLWPGRVGRWMLSHVPEWTGVRYRLVWWESPG